MAKKLGLAILVSCLILSSSQVAQAYEEGWISLFDGKSFDGWKVNENKDTFSIRDGMIVVNGNRSHLFYDGPVENHNFKNFELKVDVMTKPNSNSGIYFHTEFQKEGWPAKGYEVQVNSSHSDWRKSGSLWAVQDIREATKDNEWFTESIIVWDKHIIIKINGKTVVDWTEPENWQPPSGMDGRKISSGTFALQGHDPGSTVYFKNIRVKPLQSRPKKNEGGWIELFNGEDLEGWKVNRENPDTFSTRNGMIVVNGPRTHLFYDGPVENHNFKNFELKVEVMTKPHANSGIYFHTEYQDKGWPAKGYEVQVNNTHSDWRKTGSLYAVKDVREAVKDNEWFTEHIIVEGKHIVIKVNGKTTVDWTEPEDWAPPRGMSGRKISSGTFALQGHDPKSVIYYRSVKVKPLLDEEGWISLFDGKSFNGWKVNENPETFSIRDGMIVVNGNRSHLFYDGPVEDHNFKNFELKVDVMTKPNSNSGVYFHTAYQNEGWPAKGYEVQVNSSHGDWRKSGSLWAVQDIREATKDDEWFTEHIIVEGKHIVIKIDGKTVVDWVEPENWQPPQGMDGRKISSGTFALQGHDPGSTVYFKNIRVKPLPGKKKIKAVVLTGGHGFEREQFFKVFEGYDDIEYTEFQLKDDSEVFEDVSDWDYDVIVLYNMTKEISPKRRRNFARLLRRQGVGLVALHHMMGAYPQWQRYPRITGGKYFLEETDNHRGSTYKHDLDLNVHIEDTSHPITRGMSDFKIHDEGYKYCGFEKDNHVLLTTEHPDCDRTIGWVRNVGEAKVFGMMMGHDSKAYENPNFRKLVARAIRWTAGQLD